MPFDGLVLRAVCQELQDKTVGARVEKVYQSSALELTLHIRRQGVNRRLFFSVHPQMARVHLGDVVRENPLVPPMFCQLLRKHLEGARIVRVEQPGLERALTVVVESRDELGNPTELMLIAELMGKHSNLILVRNDGLIVDSIKHINALKSRYREVLPGVRYLPPPAQGKLDPFSLSADDLLPVAEPALGLARWLAQTIDGISPLIAREIVLRANLHEQTPMAAITPIELRRVVNSCRELVSLGQIGCAYWYHCEHGQRSEISAVPLEHLIDLDGDAASLLPASDAIHRHYSQREARLQVEQMQQRLSAIVASALTKIRRKLSALQEDWQTTQRADEFRLWGELLKTHPQQSIKANEASVVNYYDPEMSMLSIPLDPKLSVAQNAQSYFKRYAKAKAGQKLVEAQLAKAQEEANYLETVNVALDSATEMASLRQILSELTEQKYIEAPRSSKQRQESVQAPVGPKQLTIEGCTVLVGRNNQQNDELTMRMAGQDDLWLHAKDIPGAHVVIRSVNPPEQVLLRAAQIAAYYSQAKSGSNVPVDYTHRRHVRKPRGARPGFVIYDHQRTVYVHPQEPDEEPADPKAAGKQDRL